MLLVLKPLSFILLTICKSVYAITLAFSFHKFPLIRISILILYATFSLRFSRRHFSFILSRNSVRALSF